MKRDKNIAGMLALFFGWLGLHRYYLGQNQWGLSYTLSSGFLLWMARIPFIGWILKFLWIPMIILISLIDAISFFAMDKRTFDEKYNGIPQREKRERKQYRHTERDRWEAHRNRTSYQPKKKAPKRGSNRPNPFKKSGVEKFQEYDYVGAIADFKKSLEIAPNDIASHFNLACAYSLTENSESSFYHLEKAVALGFKDFDKVNKHHALAFLRVQPDFDGFKKNGFKMPSEPLASEVKPEEKKRENVSEPDLLQTKPDLLDQLKKLGELRNQGILTEQEFEEQKRILMR